MAEARTLLEVCVARAGGNWRAIPRGTRVCQFIAEWAWATYDRGQPVENVEEFAAYWKVHPRTSYRRLGEFRELFPEHSTPEAFAALLVAAAEDRRSPAGLMTASLAA